MGNLFLASFQKLIDRYDHTTKWRLGNNGYTSGEESYKVVNMSRPRLYSYVKHLNLPDMKDIDAIVLGQPSSSDGTKR